MFYSQSTNEINRSIGAAASKIMSEDSSTTIYQDRTGTEVAGEVQDRQMTDESTGTGTCTACGSTSVELIGGEWLCKECGQDAKMVDEGVEEPRAGQEKAFKTLHVTDKKLDVDQDEQTGTAEMNDQLPVRPIGKGSGTRTKIDGQAENEEDIKGIKGSVKGQAEAPKATKKVVSEDVQVGSELVVNGKWCVVDDIDGDSAFCSDEDGGEIEVSLKNDGNYDVIKEGAKTFNKGQQVKFDALENMVSASDWGSSSGVKIARSHSGQMATVTGEATDGYFDIQFKDGTKLAAVSDMHLSSIPQNKQNVKEDTNSGDTHGLDAAEVTGGVLIKSPKSVLPGFQISIIKHEKPGQAAEAFTSFLQSDGGSGALKVSSSPKSTINGWQVSYTDDNDLKHMIYFREDVVSTPLKDTTKGGLAKATPPKANGLTKPCGESGKPVKNTAPTGTLRAKEPKAKIGGGDLEPESLKETTTRLLSEDHSPVVKNLINAWEEASAEDAEDFFNYLDHYYTNAADDDDDRSQTKYLWTKMANVCRNARTIMGSRLGN